MHSVSVNLPGAAYKISIDPGLLSRVGAELRELTNSAKAAIVTDSHVAGFHLQTLESSLKSAGFQTISATLPAGEQHKTLSMLLPVYDQFLMAKIERTTPVLALGGGVVGDMTGFLAATILRGVPFVQIPTTLLAMVDASVGGKTGVDHAAGKNLIGAFHQPIAVFIDPQSLATLPQAALQDGMAECIKHSLIRDAESFAHLDVQIAKAKQLDMPALSELISHNVAIKAKVVEIDPFEKGDRAHLNFGHTFGHAIESVSNYSYSHGQSVALGMCAAAYTSNKLGLIDDASQGRIVSTIRIAGLPTTGLKLDPSRILEAMQFDKKVKAGRVRLVLLAPIGRAIIRDDVSPALLLEALQSLK